MRITNRVLMSALMLIGGPGALAVAQQGAENSEIHAYFDGLSSQATDEVDGVAYISDSFGEQVGYVDSGCGEDCGCGDECIDGCGDACGDGCGCTLGLKDYGAKSQGDRLKLSGQLRLRYHSEGSQGFSTDGVVGGGGPGVGFQGTNEDFLLTRLLLNSDWQVTDRIRFFTSGIFAENGPSSDTFLPRIIDRNYGDFYNLFIDGQLTDNLVVRVGRFDHLYGAQRLLSPLDWANTRQRFEGIKFLYVKDDWKIDAWWSVFAPVDPDGLDEGDYNRRLYGAYATYTGAETANYDLFYIGFDDTRALAPIASDFSLHTVGGRLWGGQGSWLYEAEGGYQFGRQSGLGQDHRAGYCTLGLGKKLERGKEWNTTLWFYWDYATGDGEDPDSFERFNQLFPLAHKFLGFADFAQRSNINSPNVLLTTSPTKKLSLLFWYYYLRAADAADIVPGVATNTAPLQNLDSEDFLHTLDITAKYTINDAQNILFGYSTVWAGDKLDGGSFPVIDSDANFFYTQWTMNF